MMYDEQQRSRSQRRLSQQRTLSNSSMANLISNLHNIERPLPSTQIDQQDQDDDSSLQLLIDLARDPESSRMDKVHRLHSFIEDSIGMVELLSLSRLIKSSAQLNLKEPPLNLYTSVLPALIALILLENDI